MEGFKNSSDCLVKQYSAYRGNLTLGENMADQWGLRISENAYENWLRSNMD